MENKSGEGGITRVNLTMPQVLLERIDAARGLIPRSPFIANIVADRLDQVEGKDRG